MEEPDPEIEGMEPFQSKAAQIVLAPKWRVVLRGRILVLLTCLFDPNLKSISQCDKGLNNKQFLKLYFFHKLLLTPIS